MVKRSKIVGLGGLWLQSYGLSVRSEVMGRFYRVRRAASSLQLQPEEPVVASCGLTKTATLTMLRDLGIDLLESLGGLAPLRLELVERDRRRLLHLRRRRKKPWRVGGGVISPRRDRVRHGRLAG